jgi:nicotinamidase-related amidase
MRLVLLPSLLGLVVLFLTGAVLGGPTDPTPASPAGPDTALVIIDIQNFYFEKGSLPLTGSVEAARQARRVLERFRARQLPVVHVRHVPKGMTLADGEPTDPQYRIHPDVTPAPGEKIVTKRYANSFRETELLDYLREKGIRKLILCGMQTHMCLEATARAAADFGFEVTVIHDACATRPLEFGGRTVPADMVHAAALAALSGTYARVIATGQLLKEM